MTDGVAARRPIDRSVGRCCLRRSAGPSAYPSWRHEPVSPASSRAPASITSFDQVWYEFSAMPRGPIAHVLAACLERYPNLENLTSCQPYARLVAIGEFHTFRLQNSANSVLCFNGHGWNTLAFALAALDRRNRHAGSICKLGL